MIRSMTGYGRGDWAEGGKRIEVEAKSSNHRFLEIVLHLPRRLDPLEVQVRNQVRQRLSRGRVEISVQIDDASGGEPKLELNLAAACDYYRALKSLQEHLGIAGEVRLETLVAFRDLFIRKETPVDLDREWAVLQGVVQKALDHLEEMRRQEGRALRQDLLGRLALIEEMGLEIEKRNGEALPAYRDRLAQRLQALSEGIPVDPARLAQEVAILAERSDITEELVRLRSHLNQFREMLDQAEPVGRKLDFLIQEMNRETNTIGSKSMDAGIGQTVVRVKSELEKIREQLQNIE